MSLLDFEYSSAFLLGLTVLRCLLLGALVVSSKVWNSLLVAVLLGLGVVLVGLGMLFKLEHWFFAEPLLAAGALLVLAVYGWWFSRKRAVLLLDYLKLAWVLGAGATMLALAFYRPAIHPAAVLTQALFWAMALLFVYQRWIRPPGRQLPG